MPRKDAPSGPISAQAQQDLVSDGIENFELPKSLVAKIAKSVLPENAKLQKESVLSLVKGSTVFINMLAATAHDVAVSKQHKSISASDVLKALEMIQFGDLVDKLQSDLLVYRANAKNAKNDDKIGTTSASVSAPTTKKAPGATSNTVISIPYAGGNASTSGAASASASAPAPAKGKSKGKEKERDLGAPFTSVPLTQVRYAPQGHEQGQEKEQADVYMQPGQQEAMEVDPEDQDQELDAEDLDQDQDEAEDVGEDADEGVSEGADEEGIDEDEDQDEGEEEEAGDAMDVEDGPVDDSESGEVSNYVNAGAVHEP